MDSTWIGPFALLGVGLLINAALLWKMWTHYNRLTAKISKKELMEALNQILKENEDNKLFTKNLEKKFLEHQKVGLKDYSKLGFKRFNPFSDTGGDQSFCLCLLTAEDDGIMISSLHSRENTRLYAKIITNGRSGDQNLSREETEVLKQAIKQ